MAPENQKKTDPSTILGDHYANPQPTKIHITEDTEAKGDLAGAYDYWRAPISSSRSSTSPIQFTSPKAISSAATRK